MITVTLIKKIDCFSNKLIPNESRLGIDTYPIILLVLALNTLIVEILDIEVGL